jgi:hypothetical protein
MCRLRRVLMKQSPTTTSADVNQPQCTLPAVSWVVPDGTWSDHAGLDPDGAGPAWVSAIVNAVGGYYYDISGQPHRTFCQNPDGSAEYWKNTVILVTWDDWGGWYDFHRAIDTTKCPTVIKVMASQLTWLFGAGRTFAAKNRCTTATTQCATTTSRVSTRALVIVFPLNGLE